MEEAFSRSAVLLGKSALARLAQARVAVFGLGGVGGYAAEALARSGVGNLMLVDHDTVDVTNINRQILALHSTLGQPKVEVMARRIADIHPAARVQTRRDFILPGAAPDLAGCDYVVDAIDTLTGKAALVLASREQGVPILSAMGCGDRLDPARLKVADLYDTRVCPLCRAMRDVMRRRGVDRLKVVYSQEPPAPHRVQSPLRPSGRPAPGSLPFVPAAAGLLLAAEVVKDLCGPLWPGVVKQE